MNMRFMRSRTGFVCLRYVESLTSIVVLSVVTLLAGCGGNGSGSSTGGTATQASPTTESGGADGFRQFAATVDAALSREDMRWVTDRVKGEAYTCQSSDVTPSSADCRSVGQQVRRISISQWKGEGGPFPVQEAINQLQGAADKSQPSASDAYGDGRPRVYALGTVDGNQATVITMLVARPANFVGSGPLRIVEVISWKFDEGRWSGVALMNAAVMADDLLVPTADARMLIADWQRFPN